MTNKNKIETIIELLKELNLIEAQQLVSAIESTFGVSAQSSQVNIEKSSTDKIQTNEKESESEKKTSFNVVLESIADDKRISVLKCIRTLTTLGLKEAKDFTTSLPKALKENISKDEAESVKQKLEEAGGKAKIV